MGRQSKTLKQENGFDERGNLLQAQKGGTGHQSCGDAAAGAGGLDSGTRTHRRTGTGSGWVVYKHQEADMFGKSVRNSVQISWLNSLLGVNKMPGTLHSRFPVLTTTRQGGKLRQTVPTSRTCGGPGRMGSWLMSRESSLHVLQQMTLGAVSLLRDLKSSLLGHFVSDKIEAGVFDVIDILLVLEVTRNDGWVFNLFFFLNYCNS